jgi:hypothetical protein
LDWHADTYILAADDLYAVQSRRTEGIGQDKETYQYEFIYERHERVPVLRSELTAINSPAGARGAYELEVVDRRFGPISEEEFEIGSRRWQKSSRWASAGFR